MGFFGGPTDRVGDSFNFFVHPLSKLCVSDTHFCVREKHAINVVLQTGNYLPYTSLCLLIKT